MKEIWKPIKGYEGFYQISNFGRVKSCERKVWYKKGYWRKNKGKILRLSENGKDKSCNYLRVHLSKGNKSENLFVHRLVAEHFIEKKSGCDFVNHIDGDKQNNHASNLEWVTPKQNKMHAVYTGLDIPNYGIKKVYCLTNGKVYPSASFAERELGLPDSSVNKVCNGKTKSTKGMVFRYV